MGCYIFVVSSVTDLTLELTRRLWLVVGSSVRDIIHYLILCKRNSNSLFSLNIMSSTEVHHPNMPPNVKKAGTSSSIYVFVKPINYFSIIIFQFPYSRNCWRGSSSSRVPRNQRRCRSPRERPCSGQQS